MDISLGGLRRGIWLWTGFAMRTGYSFRNDLGTGLNENEVTFRDC